MLDAVPATLHVLSSCILYPHSRYLQIYICTWVFPSCRWIMMMIMVVAKMYLMYLVSMRDYVHYIQFNAIGTFRYIDGKTESWTFSKIRHWVNGGMRIFRQIWFQISILTIKLHIIDKMYLLAFLRALPLTYLANFIILRPGI